jgi:phosphatidylglycerophosphate synthase
MAQTKRKRRTKHRGTAAGTVTTRGRTGRPPTPAERKKQTRDQARQTRLNTPPTWASSAKRAGLATGFMFILLLVLTLNSKNGNVVGALVFALLAFALYVPGGYYLETYLYRRRQRQKDR